MFFQISTHTSRVGCDKVTMKQYENKYKFLLTHPVWDVTTTADVNDNVLPISTHTSRVGCDHMLSAPYFYNQISTHTSRVGCDSYTSDGVSVTDLFLLTHPVWDVTQT